MRGLYWLFGAFVLVAVGCLFWAAWHDMHAPGGYYDCRARGGVFVSGRCFRKDALLPR